MRPRKILGNYGHHAGLVSDPTPSGRGCIRLVSTGPPRNHIDTDAQDIESQTLTQSARQRERAVNLVAVHRFPRDISLGKLW
jgi:hypothetical protein